MLHPFLPVGTHCQMYLATANKQRKNRRRATKYAQTPFYGTRYFSQSAEKMRSDETLKLDGKFDIWDFFLGPLLVFSGWWCEMTFSHPPSSPQTPRIRDSLFIHLLVRQWQKFIIGRESSNVWRHRWPTGLGTIQSWHFIVNICIFKLDFKKLKFCKGRSVQKPS